MARIGLVVAVAVICVIGMLSGGVAGEKLPADWFPAVRSSCKGSMAECMAEGEFVMDSEISRRILANNKYISYGALQKNSVPCSRRGASYYNCQPGAQSNPYSRGCSNISRCRK